MSSEEVSILLLGGSSFLGLHTAQALYYNYSINCTYNTSQSPLYYSEFEWFKFDILDDSQSNENYLNRILQKSKIKYCINFAAISSPQDAKTNQKNSNLINVVANELLAKVCSKNNVIPIFISSDHVFNGLSGPYEESDKPVPLKHSVYGHQKLMAERAYQAYPKYAILRLSVMLGINNHFQKQNIYAKTLSALINGKNISGAVNKVRTPSHCYNVAFMINKIIDSFENNVIEKGIFHIPGELLSEYDLMMKIAQKHDLDQSLISKSTITDDNESYPLKLGLKHELTKKVLKGKYLTLDEGLVQLKKEFSESLN